MAVGRWGLVVCGILAAGFWLWSPGGAQELVAQETASEAAEKRKQKLSPSEADYELFKLFVDTLDQVERNYVEEIDRRELVEAAIRGLIDKLDPYSNYISPDQVARFRQQITNRFGGIGIQITLENGRLKILSPLVGTPAYRAGLHAGDEISEIEGEPTKGITIDEAIQRLKGEVDTSVNLTIRAAYTGKTRQVKLTREVIRIDTVLGDEREDDDSWDFMLDDKRKIGYIRITSFGRETPRELRSALQELEDRGVKALILDLRFNPGGLLTAAIDVCDLFVTEGTIVSVRGRNVVERTYSAHRRGTYTDWPMAVLINRYSASASEIVSACLQDHQRAVVIGDRSWGKGSVQNVIDLEGGKSALKLTTASYWRPSGKNIHRMPGAPETAEWGVTPNDGFVVKLSPEQRRKVVEVRRKRDIVAWERTDAVGEQDDQGEPSTAETKPTQTKPTQTKPTENKPTETKQSGSQQSGPKPQSQSESSTPQSDQPKRDPQSESGQQGQSLEESQEAPQAEDSSKENAESQKSDSAETDSPGADPQQSDPEQPDEQGTTQQGTPEQAGTKSQAKSEQEPLDEFIDPQVKKAVDYLATQLEKSQAKQPSQNDAQQPGQEDQ